MVQKEFNNLPKMSFINRGNSLQLQFLNLFFHETKVFNS